MKRFLTLAALIGGVSALSACSMMPECSSSELDGCGRDMAYTEERTVPIGQHPVVVEEEEVVVVEEPAPEPIVEPEPMPEPEPVMEPDDSQVMQQADEPSYVKGMK